MRVVELLHSEGFVTLEVQYIDGTKIESVANKYTVNNHIDRVKQQPYHLRYGIFGK